MTTFELPVSLRVRGSLDAVWPAWSTAVIAEKWLCDKFEGDWTAGTNVYWYFGDFRQELRVKSVEPR